MLNSNEQKVVRCGECDQHFGYAKNNTKCPFCRAEYGEAKEKSKAPTAPQAGKKVLVKSQKDSFKIWRDN